MSTFTRFNSGDIVLSTEKIHSNAWTDDLNTLSTFHTSSTEALNYANPSTLQLHGNGAIYTANARRPTGDFGNFDVLVISLYLPIFAYIRVYWPILAYIGLYWPILAYI